jgi:hypothetical protein
MCRIRWRDLPNDQEIVQHPHRSELLLNGRFGSGKVLNPGSHMERPHGRELQAVSGAPIKKLPASSGVGLPSVPVSDRGSEKVNVGFSNFRAGSSNQLRKPGLRRSTSNDRAEKRLFFVSLCELIGTTFCALFGISMPT